MSLLKFDRTSEELFEELEKMLQDLEITDYPEGGGSDPPILSDGDVETPSYEGNLDEILDHLEERIPALERTAVEFAEPMGGSPRYHYEANLHGAEGGQEPHLTLCLVLDSPASPARRLYFCDTVVRVEEDYYLAWDLPDARPPDSD